MGFAEFTCVRSLTLPGNNSFENWLHRNCWCRFAGCLYWKSQRFLFTHEGSEICIISVHVIMLMTDVKSFKIIKVNGSHMST